MILFQAIYFSLSMILLITQDLAAGRYLLVDIDDSQGISIFMYSSYKILIEYNIDTRWPKKIITLLIFLRSSTCQKIPDPESPSIRQNGHVKIDPYRY